MCFPDDRRRLKQSRLGPVGNSQDLLKTSPLLDIPSTGRFLNVRAVLTSMATAAAIESLATTACGTLSSP